MQLFSCILHDSSVVDAAGHLADPGQNHLDLGMINILRRGWQLARDMPTTSNHNNTCLVVTGILTVLM